MDDEFEFAPDGWKTRMQNCMHVFVTHTCLIVFFVVFNFRTGVNSTCTTQRQVTRRKKATRTTEVCPTIVRVLLHSHLPATAVSCTC